MTASYLYYTPLACYTIYMNKITVGAIAAILLAFGGLVVWSSLNSGNGVNYANYDTKNIISADENNGNIADHVRGKEDSKVVLVEYADLQCPGCASMMPKISELYKEYGDRVAFIFRNYPINGHQNARAASAAVESAGLQGYYWQMLETMYDNRNDWISVFDTEKRTNIFAGFFEEISGGKGDVEKFKAMLGDANIQKKIDFDKNIGAKQDKIDATPSFFVNGRAVDVQSVEDIKNEIEKMLNEELKNAGLEVGPKVTNEEKSE